MSIPVPIPSNINCSYFFLPYRVQDKTFSCSLSIKVGDTIMDVKQQMAQHAREYYHKPITAYEIILARIEKQDFTL